MSIMDLNIAQDLYSIDQDPLLLVLLELRKSYDTLERRRIIHTLEGYGTGSKLRGILEDLWED